MKKIFFLIFITIFSPTFAMAGDYNFVCIADLAEQKIGQFLISEVYRKMGIKISIAPLPANRAKFEVDRGYKDGEIMRIWSYGENNPLLIRVPTPYYKIETMVFKKKDRNIIITNKNDLSIYKLGKVRGVKHTIDITKGLKNIRDFNNTKQMMRLLEYGRFDLALTDTRDGLYTLKRMSITDIYPLPKPLATHNLYHYIHVKHKALVPKVNQAIKNLIDSGEMKALIKKAQIKVLGEAITISN